MTLPISSPHDAARSLSRTQMLQKFAVPILPALLAWIILIRLPFFSFDVLSVDEAVYLALGSGLRYGLIPYVDLIDRKPIGIFLIYAAADVLFKDPIMGVRIFGMISTFIASVLLIEIGQRFLNLRRAGSFLVGFLYSTYALLFYGDSGQTPVFYMPFVIGGAWLVMAECKRLIEGEAPSVWKLGLAGLALGISLQIKYSTFFECVLLGCIVLHLTWRARTTLGFNGVLVAGMSASAMLVGGLLPTIIAYVVYTGIGHGDAFVFYNFTVNLSREATDFARKEILFRGVLFALCLLPLMIKSFHFLLLRHRNAPTPTAINEPRWISIFITLWFIAALIGALAQRQPYATYFFDCLAPLALLSAATLQRRLFDRRPTWATKSRAAIVLVLPIVGYFGLHVEKLMSSGSPWVASDIARDLRAIGAKTMYNFNSFGIIHAMANIPLPSRYPYPDHLLRDLEGRSFQFDGVAEIDRILSTNPDALLVRRPIKSKVSAARVQLIETKIANDYCRYHVYQAGKNAIELYLHKDSGLPVVEKACAVN